MFHGIQEDYVCDVRYTRELREIREVSLISIKDSEEDLLIGNYFFFTPLYFVYADMVFRYTVYKHKVLKYVVHNKN